jgi:predicted sugar kinase
MLFASVQGGSYNGLEVASTIATLQAMGVQGVGQSSWGPGVFAWFESQASLNQFQQDCQSHHFRIMATGKVNNQGRQLIDRR